MEIFFSKLNLRIGGEEEYEEGTEKLSLYEKASYELHKIMI